MIQNAETIEKIRQTKVPATALHDADLEARVTDEFLFSYHDKMLASRFDKPSQSRCMTIHVSPLT